MGKKIRGWEGPFGWTMVDSKDQASSKTATASFHALRNLKGWCWVLPLQPTKANGYVQVSWRGVNKVVVLQELALWANDTVVEKGQENCLLPWESLPNSQEPNANEPYLQDKKKDEKQEEKNKE
ncbi:hypothetical protein PENSUB_7911 [Penicillium subrubescens]|uniref:Uncharacterized protein n=1 Tax=Penicillium subrubescens TaxID=1316194 RepID=A0A1Q5TJQ2_9EURO|nr:hypothetical protein PENSUB_7911 [Penicillium subrubescens]